MRLKFLQDYKPKGDAPDIPTYKKGQVYEFVGPVAKTYVDKFLARGVAEMYVEPPPPQRVLDRQKAKEEPKAEQKPADKPADHKPAPYHKGHTVR